MSNTNLLGAYGGLGNSGLQFRNRIINGDMRIHQRGGTVTTSGYPVDRLLADGSGATMSVSQQTLSDADSIYPEFQKFVRMAVSVGNDSCGLNYRVEDAKTFAGQTVTFSFWAKGTNPGGGNFNIGTYQALTTGGATDVFTDVGTLVVSSSWKRYTYTTTLPAISSSTTVDSNSYIQLHIRQPGTDASTAAWTLDTTGWQLEAGPVATPFEHRPVGLEILLCQRYYEKSFDFHTAPANGADTTSFSTNVGLSSGVTSNLGIAAASYSFRVEKRTVPNMTRYGNSQGYWQYARPTDATALWSINVASSINQNASTRGFSADQQVVNGTFIAIRGHWTADAEL